MKISIVPGVVMTTICQIERITIPITAMVNVPIIQGFQIVLFILSVSFIGFIELFQVEFHPVPRRDDFTAGFLGHVFGNFPGFLLPDM
jgi:hypothetical protein